MIIDVFTQSILLLTQNADCNYKVQSISDFLDLHDAVGINIALGDASDLIVFTDHATVNHTLDVAAANELVFAQSTQPRVFDVAAENWLVLAHTAIHEDQWPLLEQSIVFVQEAVGIVAYGTYDSFDISDEATYTIVKLVTAESNFDIQSDATAYKPDKMWISDPTLTVEAP